MHTSCFALYPARPLASATARWAPFCHPGPRAGVQPWLSMPPQPVESRLNR